MLGGKLGLPLHLKEADNRRFYIFMRVAEKRNSLQKVTAYLPRMQREIRVCRQASAGIFGVGDVSMPAYTSQRLIDLAQEPAEQTSPCSIDVRLRWFG